MSRQIVPFTPEHIGAAAELLAKRHRRDRAREPRLPAQYEDPEGTKLLIADLLERATGVAMIEDGHFASYMLSVHETDWGGRARLVPMQGHAVETQDVAEAYREMYAAASPPWVEQGYFEHSINVPATDEVALGAFASLTFGQMLVFAVRGTEVPAASAPEVRIERARPEDVDAVGALLLGLSRYNSTPPLYRPYVPNPGPGWAGRDRVLKQLEDENCCFVLAYEGDEAVGLVILTPPEPSEGMISGDKTVYLWIGYVKPRYRSGGIGKALVERGLAWASERGFEHCTVGWFTANVTGARFWTRRGYGPAMCRLERRLDPRIAWARAQDV